MNLSNKEIKPQTFFGISYPLCGETVLACGLQQQSAEGLHHGVRLADLNLQVMSVAAVACRETTGGVNPTTKRQSTSKLQSHSTSDTAGFYYLR